MVYEGGGTSSTEATTRPPGGGTGTPVATGSLTGNVLPFDDSPFDDPSRGADSKS